MRHHTKDKGDAGLGFVIATLMSQGIEVALPIGEHLPFDCIAISEDGRLSRVSVKYRAATKLGVVKVRLESYWADRHGTHVRKHGRADYDAIAIYCPDSSQCYFVRCAEIEHGTLTLRLSEAKNGQAAGVRLAIEYKNPNRIFAPVA
jgi:hypothetical protein